MANRWERRLKALEDAGRGDCVVCGWGPRTALYIEWDHDDPDEQNPGEPKYCPACGNPSVLVIRWPDQENQEEIR